MRCNPEIRGLYRKSGSVLILMALATAMLVMATPVRADMLISPLRVLLDKDNQTASIILNNPSDGARTYRLEWVDQQMSEDGVYRPYKEGESRQSASSYLRLAPRQITVAAKSSQSVRVSFHSNADMAPGEYRSHLLFKVLEDVSEPYSVSKIGAGEGMTMQLNMQLSMSIPVVIRYRVTAQPNVKIAKVEPVPTTAPGQAAQLAVVLQRSGVASSFGRVIIEMQVTPDAPVEKIGQADNISIFTDMAERRLILSLRDSSIPAGAWLRIAYEGTDEYAGVLWDEKVFQSR